MDAKLVDPATHQATEAAEVVHHLVDRLRGRAEELGCSDYLEIVGAMADRPTGSVRQLKVFEETNNLAEVVRRMLAHSEPAAEAVGKDACDFSNDPSPIA